MDKLSFTLLVVALVLCAIMAVVFVFLKVKDIKANKNRYYPFTSHNGTCFHGYKNPPAPPVSNNDMCYRPEVDKTTTPPTVINTDPLAILREDTYSNDDIDRMTGAMHRRQYAESQM